MTRIVLAAAIVCLLPLGAGHAAGPFDGEWSGGSPGIKVGNRNCPPTTAKGTVANDRLTGIVEVPYTFKFGGPVKPDGSFTGRLGNLPLTGKFSGDHFSGSYQSAECGIDRPFNLDKVK